MKGEEPTAENTREADFDAAEQVVSTENIGFVVYALVRSSSKYAYQGVVSGMPVMMRLTRVDDRDEYAFHLENGNRYRREDLTFFAKSSDGIVIKLR